MSMATFDTEAYLDTNQAAKALGLHPQSVKIYCQKGKLNAVKVGRSWMISKSEVLRYKEDRASPGRPRKDD